MKSTRGIGLEEVSAVYEGSEGQLFELIMGQLIHVGGFQSSMDLAERAGIGGGPRGVDLCCGNGAGMRFLVRFRAVASMVGIEASSRLVARGRRWCENEDLADRIRFIHADACESALPDGSVDFAWGEDAWCYVVDKEKLVAEAVRIVRRGGTIAFTDWVEGPAGLPDSDAERFLGLMKFSNLQDIEGYRRSLEKQGCEVMDAEETGRFARYFDLYHDMIELQLTYDALKIVGFDRDLLGAMVGQLAFVRELGHARKVTQARFIARKG